MTTPTQFTTSIEYRLHVEDVDFRLLIEDLLGPPSNNSENHGLHRHEFSEMFVCVSGMVPLMTETGLLELHDGEAAVILPGVLHQKQTTKRQTEWYTVSFSGTRRNIRDCGGLYRNLRIFFDGDYILTIRGVQDLAADIQRIEGEFRKENTFLPPLLLISLLLKMADTSIQIHTPISPDRPPVPGELHRFMKMDEIIEGRFKEVWNAQRIAEALNISSRQVDRIARKRYGKPFRQAMMDKRCQIAAHLLSTTEMSGSMIMTASGFCSIKSLYREFKQRYDMTPMEYRRSHAFWECKDHED